MIKQLPAFPAAPRFYTEEVAADIVAQYSFRNNSLTNEANREQRALLIGGASVANGRLKTGNVAADSYVLPVDFYGGGDFTIECNFRILSDVTVAAMLLGQWYVAATQHDYNRITVRVQPDLSILVCLSNSSIPGDYIEYMTPAKIQIGRDYHVAVERWEGVIRVFLDGVLQVSWEQPSAAWAIADNVMNGHFYSITAYAQREIWNVRVAKRAMYKGNVPRGGLRELPFFAEADNVAQFTFARSSLKNEAIENSTMTLEGGAVVDGDYIKTTAFEQKYSFPCEYFGAGDFTVECKVIFTGFGTSGGAYILGQYRQGSADHVENSWNFRIQTSNNVLFWLERRRTVTTYSPVTLEGERFAFRLNREYHVVAERVGKILSIYVDGQFYSSFESATPLTNSPIPVMSETSLGDAYGQALRKIRDIRIAKRAIYNGNIPFPFRPVTLDFTKGSLLAIDKNALVWGKGYKNEVVDIRNVALNPDGLLFSQASGSTLTVTTPTDLRSIGSSNFTLDMEVTFHTTDCILFQIGGGLNIAWSSILVRTNGGRFFVALSYSNTKYDVGGESGSVGFGKVQLRKRTRITIIRSGSTLNCYINGLLQKTFTVSGSLYNTNTRSTTVCYAHDKNNTPYGSLNGVLHYVAFHKTAIAI